mmetsp:Transcript_19509/g.50163  ORF Transcript_19509/g.50163 Transcript_19509/m.50163 type:complete len:88 (+) Transcript_19509:292-555(+)|eukprot:7391843-Prymnesium_polylepis.1
MSQSWPGGMDAGRAGLQSSGEGALTSRGGGLGLVGSSGENSKQGRGARLVALLSSDAAAPQWRAGESASSSPTSPCTSTGCVGAIHA